MTHTSLQASKDTPNQIEDKINEIRDSIVNATESASVGEVTPAQFEDMMSEATRQLTTLIEQAKVESNNEGHFFTHKDMKGGAIDYGWYHYCKCGYEAGGHAELEGHINWQIANLTNKKEKE